MKYVSYIVFLVVDIGNTLQKAVLFDASGNVAGRVCGESVGTAELESLCQGSDVCAALISAVGNVSEAMVGWLSRRTRLLRLSPALKLPVRLKYETVETLGSDRMACAVAAATMFPKENVLVVQAGTCLVTDFVSAENEYCGGSISPGLQMRFKALHQYTAGLPLVSPQQIEVYMGTSTRQSMLSGVINGMSAEIDAFVERYRQDYGDLRILLTGGDAPFLERYLKNRIFAAPNLVAFGLYNILRYNEA